MLKFGAEIVKVFQQIDQDITDVETRVSGDAEIQELKSGFSTLLTGVKNQQQSFDKVFRNFGICEYNPVDEKFDPNLHEAISMVNDESKEPGTVCYVMKTGWKIQDRVLRAAKVF
mmetsp:Transcript_26365/g.30488  ORF Transcript_26365/g.30488 Transcript_26365/m.30488 type:complete len:115 (-) Transcript_26365:40-384(-)